MRRGAHEDVSPSLSDSAADPLLIRRHTSLWMRKRTADQSLDEEANDDDDEQEIEEDYGRG